MMSFLKKKHFLHGLLFVLAGLFMFGRYVIPGQEIDFTNLAMGHYASVGMLLFGVFLFLWGEGFFQGPELLLEYYDAIFVAVGIALVIRTFLVEPFKIPSGSMIPTLLVGDYLFVNKYSYGYRVPFTRSRIFMGEGPGRGDVVVFEFPQDPTKDYIKRIIGLPGDQVEYLGKRVFINGKALSYQESGTFDYQNENNHPVSAVKLVEKIGDKEHALLIDPFRDFQGVQTSWTVPPGHYFVMGDNRDNSNDSRSWGFVPDFRLVGKAVRLFWSWDGQDLSLRWSRLGSAVK